MPFFDRKNGHMMGMEREWLRALVMLAEDLGLVSCTHMVEKLLVPSR